MGFFEIIDNSYSEQMKQFQNEIFKESVNSSQRVTVSKNLGISNAISAAFALGLFLLVLFA